MKLYYSPGACSLASHIALIEAGITYSIEKVDLGAKKTESGTNFLDINPKGQVPTLQLNEGSILTEGAVILQYISDKAPEKNLMPAFGTLERYHALEWLNFVATELHKNYGLLFSPNINAETKELAKTILAAKYAVANNHLSNNTYLLGAQFSVADCYLYTVMTWAKSLGLDLSKFSALTAYLARVETRASVTAARKEEGLPEKIF